VIIDLIAALSAGFAVFGLALILNHLTGRRLPRWAYPAAFGLGMLAYSVWSEVTWDDRTLAAQPHLTLAEAPLARSWYRPWTWVAPQPDYLVALDRRFLRVNPGQPDLVLVRVVRLARFVPESGFLAVFDCARGRIAPLAEGADLATDGTLPGADWTPLPAGDALLTGACALREPGAAS